MGTLTDIFFLFSKHFAGSFDTIGVLTRSELYLLETDIGSF